MINSLLSAQEPTHDELTPNDIQRLFHEAMQHKFLQDPAAWLQAHGERFRTLLEKRGTGCLCCIDEGVQDAHENGIHEAGSGILYERDRYRSRGDRMRAYANNLLATRAEITKVTSHAGCGAAALAAKEAGYEDADGFGKDWSAELSNLLRVTHEHIESKSMDRPAHFHDAVAILYSPGGTPDYRKTGMPKAMNISRWAIQDNGHAQGELALATQILRGAHGFGERFTKENPLTIIVPQMESARDLSIMAEKEAQAVAERNDWIRVVAA